ncbi:hypothetical protein B0O99DRAFT_627941 [Bisporella sp. PMI_857]|nr:hypothetical protein B0O99DRAFT_627941 [Bisporella sp. PMI_857]
MRPRRMHKKSRHGCDQCKKRRVKCDEVSPTCSNCTSRETECHYSIPTRRTHPQVELDSASNPTTPDSAGSRSESVTATTDSLRVDFCSWRRRRELELMQFWFSKTYQSFTLKHSDLFKGHAVSESLKHEYLADSIFALTSLHIATETSDPALAASYVSIALQYQNGAIALFNSALHDVTQSNCDAIFISSIIIMACSVVSPFLLAGDNELARSSLDSVLALHEFMHGIRSIVDISRHWIESGPCRTMFRIPYGHGRRAEIMENETVLPITQLRHLNDMVNCNDRTRHNIYGCAIKQLECCSAEDKYWAVTWLVSTGRDFIDGLRKREPMALAILIYWGVLLDKLDQIWWAKYSGRRLVEGISTILLSYGPQWDEATAWRKDYKLHVRF